MPRIDDEYLDCVVYLYPTEQAAREGKRMGGSGFIVGYPSARDPRRLYMYAVTNSHVIREARSPVLRMNTLSGETEIGVGRAEDWLDHPDGDDLSVLPVAPSVETIRFRAVLTGMFLTPALIQQEEIGPGDETFMLGRFSSHQGIQTNTPTARFGNISMMPRERVRTKRGLLQEAFLVETRSLSGFSGSLVFVYLPPGRIRPSQRDPTTIRIQSERGPWLLGVDFGHMKVFEPVLESDEETAVSANTVVGSNSGQMAVVPAWKLLELLNHEELVRHRQKFDDALAKSGG